MSLLNHSIISQSWRILSLTCTRLVHDPMTISLEVQLLTFQVAWGRISIIFVLRPVARSGLMGPGRYQTFVRPLRNFSPAGKREELPTNGREALDWILGHSIGIAPLGVRRIDALH